MIDACATVWFHSISEYEIIGSGAGVCTLCTRISDICVIIFFANSFAPLLQQVHHQIVSSALLDHLFISNQRGMLFREEEMTAQTVPAPPHLI